MRPPVLPSGNQRRVNQVTRIPSRFNEAAGFTQRKLVMIRDGVLLAFELLQ